MIQVPFIFKDIVDNFSNEASALNQTVADVATTAVPLSLVLGYGIARSSFGLQEARMLFSQVCRNRQLGRWHEGISASACTGSFFPFK